MNDLTNVSDFEKLIENEKKESGFYDLPTQNKCNDPRHKPPTHIHIPHGKGYKHKCPSCGNVVNLIPPQISF